MGGAVDSDGQQITEPWALQRARLIDGLCQRYGCLPSALRAEDAHEILQMQAILGLAGDTEGQAGQSDDDMSWFDAGKARMTHG